MSAAMRCGCLELGAVPGPGLREWLAAKTPARLRDDREKQSPSCWPAVSLGLWSLGPLMRRCTGSCPGLKAHERTIRRLACVVATSREVGVAGQF